MRRILVFVMLGQGALVVGFVVALRSGAMPLGVRGEWEWLRLRVAPAGIDLVIASLAVLAYAVVAGVGMRVLGAGPSAVREALAVAGLLVAAVATQVCVPWGAPEGYGLAKWAIALHSPGTSGYYTVARRQVPDPWRFLAEYPDWIKRQDSLHIGTHPPGLFLVEVALLRVFEARPGLAKRVMDHLPVSIDAGFRAIGEYDPLPRADRAALAATGALTLFSCAATVVPLYLLARSRYPAATAWAAAALWPLVPSAILFQPASDTAIPLLSTTALALASYAGRATPRWALSLAIGSGVVLAVGMAFTLAFLAVGLIVAIVLAGSPGLTFRRRGALIAATGAGFLVPTLTAWAVTGADPFVIWWWNQKNHARFYVEFPRTYRAWLVANPIELAIALGLPATVWAGIGLLGGRDGPRVAWATLAVLTLLTIGGRTLSEAARLWLPMMPPLLAAAAGGLSRLGAGPGTLAATVILLGAETLALQATIQVVYPI